MNMSTVKSKPGSPRDKYLRRKYGISEQIYRQILASQGMACAICKRRPKPGRNLHVDHDHGGSRAVRGLLCFRCNRQIIGRHRDSTLLRNACDYLERPPAGSLNLYAPKPKRKKRRARIRR